MVGMSRESPGAQMVPSGVSIQKPQQSSGWKTRSLAPGLVLPGVVGGRDLHAHRSDREMLADVVTVRRQALLFHQRSHVLRQVILTGHGKITTGGNAVVVVVAVGDQHGVQVRHVVGGDWKLDHHRHVETQKGSTITVVPRLLIKKPAMPSHRRTVPSVASKASAPNGCV